MWWNFKRRQSNSPDTPFPVFDVLLPLPEPRAVVGALAALYRLQSRAGGPLNLSVHMQPDTKSTLRIRGFQGVDLDALAGCLRAILTQWSPAVSLMLSYKSGCVGALARPGGGVLQIAAGYIDSHAFEEDRAMKLNPAPEQLLVELTGAAPTLH